MSITKLKGLTLALVPSGLLELIKRQYYPIKLGLASPNAEPEFAIVRCLVQPGDRVIDIGANIGLYTTLLSRLVGPNGEVLSIEPVPETYGYLCNNVRKLRLRNVVTVNAAISEYEGSLHMSIPNYEYGGRNYYMARIIGEATDTDIAATRLVAARRLDDLVKPSQRPTCFVKCDVEGHERTALKGATKFLEQQDAAWLVEICGNLDDKQSDSYQVRELFERHGYRMYALDGNTLCLRRTGTRQVNYFFLKPIHLERLQRQNIDVDSQ